MSKAGANMAWNRTRLVAASLGVAMGLAAAPSALGEVPLIPRSVLFGNPDKASPQLSPDGTQLAFLAPVNGVMNVWVGPASDPAAAKAVTADKKRGIRQYFWAYNNKDLLYMQDFDGDENNHIYRVDVKSGETKDLTPIKGVKAVVDE